jgi:hypothetical protein
MKAPNSVSGHMLVHTIIDGRHNDRRCLNQLGLFHNKAMLAHREQAGQRRTKRGNAGFFGPDKQFVPASRLVFSIPELVSAILDQVNEAPMNQWRYNDFGVLDEEKTSRRKWTILARVNRLFFMSVIPKIWEFVDDLSCFATLFPEDLLDLPYFDYHSDVYQPTYVRI